MTIIILNNIAYRCSFSITGPPVKESEYYHMLRTSEQYPTFLNLNSTCHYVSFGRVLTLQQQIKGM